MEPEIKRRVRIRVNGLLVRNKALLLVKLKSPVSNSEVWMPPGGAIEYGETASEAVEREMREETGIKVSTEKLRYIHEVLSPKIHALELYYDCSYVAGVAKLGNDPELKSDNQILMDLQFVHFRDFSHFDIVPKMIKKHLKEDLESDFSGIREDCTVY